MPRSTLASVKIPPHSSTLAYVVGLAIGDGNLSNPNGRAVRLRISCDSQYKNLIKRAMDAIQIVMPNNKISTVRKRGRCLDISCYSNKWETLLGWKAKGGSKYRQGIKVPAWIKKNKEYSRHCLRGLIETDGSVYTDRGYVMVNFVTTVPQIAKDFTEMLEVCGFAGNMQLLQQEGRLPKYTVRIAKKAKNLVQFLDLRKD